MAPEIPKRSGYTFAGWSLSGENVKENLVIKAMYEPISITLYTEKYKTANLDARVSGSSKEVNWTTSNASIASVSKDGTVTAHKARIVYITASVDGVSVQCEIVVKKAKIAVKMGKKTVGNKTLKLKMGKKYTLKTTVVPQGKITYKVKNKKILKISSKGKITTGKKRTTTITISVNGMKKKIKVKVIDYFVRINSAIGGIPYPLAKFGEKMRFLFFCKFKTDFHFFASFTGFYAVNIANFQ